MSTRLTKKAMSKTLAYSGPDINLNAGGETSTFDAREYNNTVRDVNLWDNEW